MSQESGPTGIKLNPESVSIQSRFDSDGDLKLEIQGELQLDPHGRHGNQSGAVARACLAGRLHAAERER